MRAMTEMGHPCQIVDYRPEYQKGVFDLFQWGGVRDVVRNAHTALHYGAFKRRAQRFNAFVDDYMTLTPKHYVNCDELRADPPECDVYVAGSDQIWNPSIFEIGSFDPAFLLDFGGKGRRISYAPSMGNRAFTEGENAILRAALEPYSAVSVREAKGQELVRAATGREATVVLDPTLLLTREQWAELALPPKLKTPYILCYYISDHAVLDPYAMELKARTGLPVVQIGLRRKLPYADHMVLDAGTREFLGLFQNAAYVLTTSFHGTVFSIQFGKEFYTTIAPKEMAHPQGSRVYSLLQRLGCTSRAAGMAQTDGLDTPVDYETVNANLSAQRERCLSWLACAIEDREWREPERKQEAAQSAKPLSTVGAACTGCSACAVSCPVSAITMTPDFEGFLRPVVGESCIGCGKCENTCPALRGKKENPAAQTAWAVWNRDEQARRRASSGGFFSALATTVIGQGGAVFGAVFDDDFRGVHHVCARTEEELLPMSGSKYVQSDLRDTFRQAKELLEQGVPVLFTGLPCQIDGLRAALGKEYEGLITCDMVCHGAPSPAVFAGFMEELTARHGGKTVERLNFKAGDWNDPRFAVWFKESAGQGADRPADVSCKLFDTTFGRGFGMQIFARPSCGQCAYTSLRARPGDLTMADFWGLGEGEGLPRDRSGGISLVLANTPKGEEVLASLDGKVEGVARPVEEAVAGNPRLACPVAHNPRRAAFFTALRVRGWQGASHAFLRRPGPAYRLAAKVLTPGVKEKIRKLLG